ncbi:MAG: hypothetical protein NVS2B14_18990 [Chamaesiphon sp.]
MKKIHCYVTPENLKKIELALQKKKVVFEKSPKPFATEFKITNIAGNTLESAFSELLELIISMAMNSDEYKIYLEQEAHGKTF